MDAATLRRHARASARVASDRLRRPAFHARLVKYVAGLAMMGVGLAVMLEAGIGVGPWAVFHDGIARVTPLTFGQGLVLAGLVIASLAWGATGERPGPGTVVNMLTIGPVVDAVRASGAVPTPEGIGLGTVQFLVGIAIIGMGTGAYITARFGAGPRDMFMLGLSRRLAIPVRRARTSIEIVVLIVGVAMGGAVGLGTVLFAVLIGPVVQATLRLWGPRTASADGRRGGGPPGS